MKFALKCLVSVALLALIVPTALAQCEANLLAALDEENPLHWYQTFDVSVWTNNYHCPASGQISIIAVPPVIMFSNGNPYRVESFFVVFTEVHTVKPQVLPDGPPDSFFDIFAEVTFDDPAYPPLTYVEHARITPLNRLEIVRTVPCADNVPSLMSVGMNYCFKVCHRIYTIPLSVNPTAGQPILTISSGSMGPPADLCLPNPVCTPGDMNSFRYEVYKSGGQWYLEFEYSNPAQEPACYCVRYDGNLPLGGETFVLGGWENERQTMNVSAWTREMLPPVSGTIEIFSYPSLAQFEGGGGGGGGYRIDSFFDVFMEPFTFDPPVGAGSFMPGDTFKLIGYIHYDQPGPAYPPEWVVENVVVTPQRGIRLVNPSCTGPVVIPPQITPGLPVCLKVCHDIYHIPLVCPPESVPNVMVQSGCGPTTMCSDPSCTPGAMTDFRYDVYRVGGSWILEFEYSNESRQPVCYCVSMFVDPPAPAAPITLGAIEELGQTFEVSVRSTSASIPMNGQIIVRSDPPGANFGWHVDSFFDVFLEAHIAHIPVGPGIFMPGEVFQLVAEFDFFGPGSDPFEGQVCLENVIVTPTGQLALWDPNSPCTGDLVPAAMAPGMSVCFKVCHRVYEVVLNYLPGGGRPVIHVTPGCNGMPMDNCTPQACVPGGPNDFVYDVYHNGIDWILRFEYSNAYIEPVCYCVTYAGNVPFDCETHELAALDEGHQQFDVSLRTFSNEGRLCPADGSIEIFSYPPGAAIGPYIDSFFDVFTEWYTVSPAVTPGSFTAGQTFQLIAHVDYTDPEYPDRWLTEDVIVSPSGEHLWINDIGSECTGDVVPPSMALGQTECFKVCHRVYHIDLAVYDPTVPPAIRITPGCFGPPQDECTPDPACTPGGVFDYRYLVWWAGDHWELEFEYSNENIEPVCYCVTVEMPLPPGETHELVALDDLTSMLDVTTWATGLTDPFDNISGQITVSSNPPGAYIGPYSGAFSGVGEDWYTIEVPVGAGTFTPGSIFEFIVLYDYTIPDFPDVVKNEWVIVDPIGQLASYDQGGECTGDNVPSSMALNSSACFKVCHRIYHISLAVTDSTSKPRIEVSLGCRGTPSDDCDPDPNCIPGERYDYRYSIVWVGDHWELEFEYSNPNIEPVCYCITVLPAICQPAFELVVQPVDTNRMGTPEPNVRLSWTCPQWGRYTVYSTTDKNNNGSPPGPGWVVEDQVFGSAGERKFWHGSTVTNDYKNYVVKCDCDPPSR